MSNVKVELSKNGERINVYFNFDSKDVAAVKKINGRTFHDYSKNNPRPYWSIPKTLKGARALRTAFGPRMVLGPELRGWARAERNIERNLRALHTADDAHLYNTPKMILDVISGEPMPQFNLSKRHALSNRRPPRPYQRADIRMMSLSNAINANQVGTGKTIEAIGAIYEAQLDKMPVLVVAPRRSLVNVWQTEFERVSGYVVLASEDPRERKGCINFVTMEMLSPRPVQPVTKMVLCVIADDLRLEKYHDRKQHKPEKDLLHACNDYQGNWYRFRSPEQADIFAINWGAFIIDEFHKTGLNNRSSLFGLAARLIQAQRVWTMSGTPIGGKPRRLWPVLNFLYPKEYKSEWAWIDDWLEIEEEEFYRGGHKQKKKSVGGIREELEDEFYDHHKKHMVRRIKAEALPGLPPAVEILVPTPMLPKQRKVYEEFDKNHEVIVNGKRVSGSIVLAQYTRLRSFANIANGASGKLDPLLEKLDENGVRKLDYEPGARAYIGCVERASVTFITQALRKIGIACDELTGSTKDSKPLLDRFNGDDGLPYVIVMTKATGGTSLNLETAGSAHSIEDSWDPDEDEQFFGRGDRGSRTTPLLCYTYRTPGTVQEYVAKVADGKKLTNQTVMKYAPEIEKLRSNR